MSELKAGEFFPNRDAIKMGMKVKEVVTGLTGVILTIEDFLSGVRHFGVFPEGDGKSSPDGRNFDWEGLQYVDDGLMARSSQPDPTCDLVLGQQYEDVVSGFKGTLTAIAYHINGCVTGVITPKIDLVPTKDGRAIPEMFDHKRLKLLNNSKPADVKPARSTGCVGGVARRG